MAPYNQFLSKDWESVRKELVKIDCVLGRRRTQDELTIVVELEREHYNPDIPILDESVLNRWYRRRAREKEKKQRPRDEETLISPSSTQPKKKKPCSTSSNHGTTNATPVQVVNSPQPKFRPPLKVLPQSPPLSQDVKPTISGLRPVPIKCLIKIETKAAVSEELDQVKSEPRDEVAPTVKIVKPPENVDRFIIHEPIDDEFAKYRDEEFEDTEISKNLKKIRSDQQKQPDQNNKTQTNPKAPRVDLFQRNLEPARDPDPPPPRNLTSDRNKKQTKPAEVPDKPHRVEPPEPPGPNWPETLKQLESNKFPIVYKELDHFKDLIKNDNLAKKLPRDFISKCIDTDETTFLVDILQLIFKLDLYNDDFEFWTALVLKFKRKTMCGPNGPMTTYKSKTNPRATFENYKRAMLILSQSAFKRNLTFKLPFHTFLYLLDMAKGESHPPNQALDRARKVRAMQATRSNGLPSFAIKAVKNKSETFNPRCL